MSWLPHRPPPVGASSSSLAEAPVVVSLSKHGSMMQRLFVTVRLPRMAGMLAWWQYAAPVDVTVGQGEHAGRIRIVAWSEDGIAPFRISPPTTRKSGSPLNAPTLQIRALAGMPKDGIVRRAARWEVSDDALIVTLPWPSEKPQAAPASTLPQPARPPAAVPPAAPPPIAVRRVPAGRPAKEHLHVLRKLHGAGGVIAKFAGLSHSELRLLRECEARGWAEWSAAGERWSLTASGNARCADAAQAA